MHSGSYDKSTCLQTLRGLVCMEWLFQIKIALISQFDDAAFPKHPFHVMELRSWISDTSSARD